MDPLTILAGIATIVLTGALTKVGENALDGSVKTLGELLQQKSPTTWRRITTVGTDQEALPEVIDTVATIIDQDEEVRQAAEKVAQENPKVEPQAIEIVNRSRNTMKNITGTAINVSAPISAGRDIIFGDK